MPEVAPPKIAAVRAQRARLAQWLVDTPTIRCAGIEDGGTSAQRVYAKLEFLQRTGTFKARGALSALLGLNERQRAAGVTAVSAGNHAIAVAFAAQALGVHARVVMIKAANPMRIERCRRYGADVVLADDVHAAFAEAERIQAEEGRVFVHPFEGDAIFLGTATLGVEISASVDDFDTVLVPIGGGGLCAGVSAAIKQLRPEVEVIGIEPRGADTMHRSFAADRPANIDAVTTIADSLGAPHAMPDSFALCRRFVDRLERVDDDQMQAAMRYLFRRQKIAVEPACAATTAALMGPLAGYLADKRVMLVMCGSNMDWATFSRYAGVA